MRFSRHVIKAAIGLGIKQLETVLCSGLVVLKNYVDNKIKYVKFRGFLTCSVGLSDSTI